jgi:hypothetical protein
MMISAFNVFKDKKYLDSAIKAGEVVWRKGLLLKGNGICHGITGNAYVLHSLFRATKDDKWLHRAYNFCLATFDPDV